MRSKPLARHRLDLLRSHGVHEVRHRGVVRARAVAKIHERLRQIFALLARQSRRRRIALEMVEVIRLGGDRPV